MESQARTWFRSELEVGIPNGGCLTRPGFHAAVLRAAPPIDGWVTAWRALTPEYKRMIIPNDFANKKRTFQVEAGGV